MKNFKSFYLLSEKKKKKKIRKTKSLKQYFGYPYWGPGWFNHDVGAVVGMGGDVGGGGE